MNIEEETYVIPSTAGVRKALAEWKAEREKAETAWESKKLAQVQTPQPTLADVMELLQKLMAEVTYLRTQSS